MRGLRRLLTPLGHALWRPLLRRRLGRVVLETIDSVPLVVLPQVFNPAVFRTGRFLARQIAALPAAASGARALDMGTGSGVGAVFAARHGYEVVAVDVNAHAVRCARINALVNDLAASITVRRGDLFAPLEAERFDLVLFNPPFFRGPPRDDLDRAWRSEDVRERFAAGLPAVLAPGGQALVVLSTDGEEEAMVRAMAERNLQVTVATEHAFGNETVRAYTVRHRETPASQLHTAHPAAAVAG